MNRRVGYRFHPTDEELIDYFLRGKINGSLLYDDIFLIDICKFEPWDLPKYAAQGSNEDAWYFFHKRELKNTNSSKPRYNRSTKTGHWKPTGKVRPIKAKRGRTEIGVKKTLVFYKYVESSKELRTNWVIHEYEPKAFHSHQADLVLCKLKEKAVDNAETSTCREAEFSRRGPSDFDVLPAEQSSSEMDRQLLLQTVFSDNVVNFNRPCTLQPQIQIDEGISIDDLQLSDDIFRDGPNGFMYHSETADRQPDPNEMDVSFFDTLGYNIQDNGHSGIYLEEIANMDSDDFHGMFENQVLNNGYSGSKEYRQMQSVQSLTETVPAPTFELQACVQSKHLPSSRYEQIRVTKNLERREKISYIGKDSKGSPIQVKLSGSSEPKAREARKRGTDVNRPYESAEEKITLKIEKEQKIVPAKTILMSTSGSNKTCSSINTETSMLDQRTAPLSVYIVNVSVGVVLFVAAIGDLLVRH